MKKIHFPILICVIINCLTIFLSACQDPSPITNGTNDENEIVLNNYILTEDETWVSENTYIIKGTLVVPTDIVLEIMPGTVVKFARDAQMKVSGLRALLKVGTPLVEEELDDPVTLTSYNSNPRTGRLEGNHF